MNKKYIITIALAACLTGTQHIHTAAEDLHTHVSRAAAQQAYESFLNARLLETLNTCKDSVQMSIPQLDGTVENLLARKADPNAVDENGNTALHWAVKPYPVLQGIPSEKNKVVREAAPYFSLNVIKTLIRAGANADKKNKNGDTPEEILKAGSLQDPADRLPYLYALETLQKAIAKKARDMQT